jgi:glycolate oxidase
VPVSNSKTQTSKQPAAADRPSPSKRSKLTPGIVGLLERELGADIVRTSSIEDYARDESGLGPYPPDCVVLAREPEHIQATLALALESGTAVTPRGAGSGKVGGCLAVQGGIVLSTEGMNTIIDIDRDDLVAVVGPGVITKDLQDAVEAENLFYPPDPASLAYCSLGGNVAANAGGPRAFKYGVTREYVLGLEVALTSGERLRVGRRTSKGVTGYDLVAGFVGSEGTFGVTTEITLKLLPRPREVRTLLASFDSLEEAGRCIDALLRAGHRPRTLELMDRISLDHVRNKIPFALPKDGAAALIEIDGEPEGLEHALLSIGQQCEAAGAREVLVAEDARSRRNLWQARRLISSSLTEAHRHKVSEDICVPRGKMVEMLRRIDRLASRFELPIACYGHAGDGNLHVNLLIDEAPESPEVIARVEDATRALFEETIALRGTLSGEHGIGLTKRDYMPLEQSDAVLEWQRRWKAMWDPDGILNPGKVLPARPKTCHE